MRFHIDSKHAPEDCGLANPDQGIPMAPNWAERCKELGITYVAGGAGRAELSESRTQCDGELSGVLVD